MAIHGVDGTNKGGDSMIPWWSMIIAFIGGAIFGIIVIALVDADRDP